MFKNLLQLQRHFNNERVCIEFIEQQRWQGKPECPHCGSEHHYRTATRLKSAELKGYKDFWCKACGKKYTSLTGSIYASTKVSLQVWISAIYLITAHKKGISSVQLAKDLGVTQKTAWFINHRIREMLKEKHPQALSNTVEVDETFVGGKASNQHASKKRKNERGGTMSDKTPVLGMMERQGKVIAIVIANRNKETILPHIYRNIEQTSSIMTDEYSAYKDIKHEYSHYSINHAGKEYVRGDIHTNTLEGFWSLFKRGIYGIYHFASAKHLQRYVDEFTYRYNSRKLPDAERFALAVGRCGNARITYARLIYNRPTLNFSR